jgi:replication factor A1
MVKKPATMRPYKNDRGEGQIFNFDLIDRDGTMIQATMFNEVAIKWFDQLQENKVYIFSGGSIKMANKKFTSIKNDFCITFD